MGATSPEWQCLSNRAWFTPRALAAKSKTAVGNEPHIVIFSRSTAAINARGLSASTCSRAISSNSAVSLRSEEHTSELQSLRHLVCRLLLEKKKKKTTTINTNRLHFTHQYTSQNTDHVTKYRY